MQQQKITPFLWFDDQAEEAAELYTSLFPNSRVVDKMRKPEGVPGRSDVLTVTFELDGQRFTALNGGPDFRFTEAVSFLVGCESQEEVDELWEKLSDGGEKGPCGWLKDRFGLSWQIVPARLQELLRDDDRDKVDRVMAAMMKMGKIEIARLEEAAQAA